MSSHESVRASDGDLPRSIEIIQAYVARRGPVTLDEEQMAVMVGRTVSMMISGVSQMLGAQSEAHALVSRYMATQAGTMLRTLGVSVEDVEMLRRGIAEDLTENKSKES